METAITKIEGRRVIDKILTPTSTCAEHFVCISTRIDKYGMYHQHRLRIQLPAKLLSVNFTDATKQCFGL
jgi:hypothetical protein